MNFVEHVSGLNQSQGQHKTDIQNHSEAVSGVTHMPCSVNLTDLFCLHVCVKCKGEQFSSFSTIELAIPYIVNRNVDK